MLDLPELDVLLRNRICPVGGKSCGRHHFIVARLREALTAAAAGQTVRPAETMSTSRPAPAPPLCEGAAPGPDRAAISRAEPRGAGRRSGSRW